jgi:RNA polymerase sigma-70 factor (ECF subfamily)
MPRLTELSDAQLLERSRKGHEDSFAELYRRRQAGIHRFALQMSGSPAVAEDVTQEVFMLLIRRPELYDPARGSLASFLFGVARNHVLRAIEIERDREPLDEEELRPVQPSVLANLAREEQVEAVRLAVLSLPARYREVVALCDLQELSYEEAAAALSCAVGTVRSRLHRARALLVEKLSRRTYELC